MTYLIPVYKGDTQDTIGGESDVKGLAIIGFRGASRLQSSRFTATPIAQVAVQTNPGRRTLTVKNEGASDVFIGGEDLTTGNGYRLGASDAITLELAGELWCITEATNEALYILSEVDA